MAALGALSLLCACAACGRKATPGTEGKGPAAESTAKDAPAEARIEVDLFAMGRVLGTVAPCGCTTDPLGGLQYAMGYLGKTGTPQASLVVAPGSFLYPDPKGPEAPKDAPSWAQANRRAETLVAAFKKLGKGLVMGLGPTDLVSPEGKAALSTHAVPRIWSNPPAGADLKDMGAPPTHRLVDLGSGVKAGVAAVVDPEMAGPLGGAAEPAAALTAALKPLQEGGANLTVAVVQGPRALAERLAGEVKGYDVMVVGHVEGVDRARLGKPATRIGDTYIVEPGEQLQTVSHLRLSLAKDKAGTRADKWTLLATNDTQREELDRVEARLKKFQADPSADKAFIARLEAERDKLKANLDGSAAPAGDAVATFEQVKITCRLPVDDGAKKALHDYDSWVADENKRRFAGVKPPAPAKGKPGYAGREECDMCHDEAVEFWKTTRHANAYETLEVDNKQFDLTCVGCHVTGWREPGGAEVVENEGLKDVQCEVCHGPGTIHVETEEEKDIRRDSPAEVCLTCHTEEHSDTFNYEAYMRDVLGPGHGEKAREALGKGPTGRELRAAGLAKAGGKCKKM